MANLFTKNILSVSFAATGQSVGETLVMRTRGNPRDSPRREGKRKQRLINDVLSFDVRRSNKYKEDGNKNGEKKHFTRIHRVQKLN